MRSIARMIPSLPPLALCLTAALVVSGCGVVKEEKKTDALTAAVTSYGSAIRWGYYETAYGYVHPDERAEIPKNIENVRATGYDVVQPPVMKDEHTAEQIARIEYLHRDVQRVRSLSDRQEWRYDADTNTWWLHSGVPEFK
ncbi:MAG: hypothetical protein U9Q81_07845 [Pseudomonadota bacterium]|nr:hypothetical protein [Pseudomonadota bacterium]